MASPPQLSNRGHGRAPKGSPEPPDPGDRPTHGIGTAVTSRKSMKPGGGGRFDAFVNRLVSEGKSASSAKAIAASAGRKKYGSAQMAKFSAQGRRK